MITCVGRFLNSNLSVFKTGISMYTYYFLNFFHSDSFPLSYIMAFSKRAFVYMGYIGGPCLTAICSVSVRNCDSAERMVLTTGPQSYIHCTAQQSCDQKWAPGSSPTFRITGCTSTPSPSISPPLAFRPPACHCPSTRHAS